MTFFHLLPPFSFLFKFRTIEAERLNFIEVKEKTSRKYNKLLKILEKEKSDLQYQLDSEQKGIHARRDSDVCRASSSSLLFFFFWKHIRPLNFSLFHCSRRGKSFKWTSFIALFFWLFPFFSFFFSFLSFRFVSFLSFSFSMQAQIKILNLMDKKEKTALALKKKKSSLMELKAQAQKVL